MFYSRLRSWNREGASHDLSRVRYQHSRWCDILHRLRSADGLRHADGGSGRSSIPDAGGSRCEPTCYAHSCSLSARPAAGPAGRRICQRMATCPAAGSATAHWRGRSISGWPARATGTFWPGWRTRIPSWLCWPSGLSTAGTAGNAGVCCSIRLRRRPESAWRIRPSSRAHRVCGGHQEIRSLEIRAHSRRSGAGDYRRLVFCAYRCSHGRR